MKKYTIGVDLGGTTITAGIVDEDCNIIAKSTCATELPQPQEAIEQKIADLCKRVLAENQLTFDDIQWVGIGTPGSVNSQLGVVDFNANFGYRDWPLQQQMENLLNCQVFIENDANAAAYGEYIAGGAKGARYAVVITLGTGIGGGIIIDGKIFAGFNYAGAELGHMVIQKDGRACMCGRNGCWEKYASARALTEDTKAAMLSHPDNMMWKLVDGDVNKVNAKTAFQGMRAGDELAKRLIDKYVEYVACGLTNVINIFQPEIVCIGGGVSREGEVLLGPVRRQVDWEDYSRDGKRRVKIKAAELFNDAGVVGAARLGDQVKT
ncbi:ROK family protein [Candidatus Allofournierella merdavium]|uniref:ROK family protein n=1 Tax=Candidatus Allofournierella merdavium TaxID=2838593 RepID=UPI00374EF58D